MSRAAILLTHFIDDKILAMYDRIRAEAPPSHDVFVSLHLGDKPLVAPPEARPIHNALYLCNNEKLLSLGYPVVCNRQGWSGQGWKMIEHVETVILSFFREHPGYAHYWGIEYDVYFRGKWDYLFDRFEGSSADLLGTTLDSMAKVSARKARMPPPFHDENGMRPPPEESVVGFFPIYRASNRFLKTVDEEYRKGWCGHYEFTWGTIAKRHKLEIEDIGGNGPYVKPHNRNVFYFNTLRRWDIAPGTFVFRPAFPKVWNRENTLWHPVKPKGNYLNHCPALAEGNIRGRIKTALKKWFYNASIWMWFLLIWRPARRSPVPVNNCR